MRDNLRIQIKQLNGTQWFPVSLKDLKGKSTLSFIAGHDFPVIAAIFNDDKPAMFISNSESDVQKYKEKAPSFYASDLQELIESEIFGGATVTALETVFGDCKYIELGLNQKQPENPKNNIYKPNISKPAYPEKTFEQTDLFN